MSVTHTVTRTYKNQNSNPKTLIEAITGDGESDISFQVPATTANQHSVIGWTHSKLQSLMISSDQDVTVYTNAASGSSPQDTIVITANQVLIWTLAIDLIARCPFSDNVTSLYITNSGGTVANININTIVNL